MSKHNTRLGERWENIGEPPIRDRLRNGSSNTTASRTTRAQNGSDPIPLSAFLAKVEAHSSICEASASRATVRKNPLPWIYSSCSSNMERLLRARLHSPSAMPPRPSKARNNTSPRAAPNGLPTRSPVVGGCGVSQAFRRSDVETGVELRKSVDLSGFSHFHGRKQGQLFIPPFAQAT